MEFSECVALLTVCPRSNKPGGMSIPNSRLPLPAAEHQTSKRPPNICPSGLPRPVSRDDLLPICLTCLGFCIGVNRLGFALDHGGVLRGVGGSRVAIIYRPVRFLQRWCSFQTFDSRPDQPPKKISNLGAVSISAAHRKEGAHRI
jgi:hypothetical protein